jgi:hypothetical protein
LPVRDSVTGCLGSIAPITNSSETDDALLGTWRQCQGTKIEIARADAESGGYSMKVTDRETHKAVTYRLLIERIGDQEFADASYAPRRIKVEHVIALIRHDGNDLLFRPMNDGWWDDEHLEGSGLHVVEAGDELYLILGKSSDLRAVLAAHPHDPQMFAGDAKDRDYGRLKRQWTAAESAGCHEDL